MSCFAQGDIVSHHEICGVEGATLQRGMNFRLRSGTSVILMSVQPGAPYADRLEENGKVLIYEGHDIPKRRGGPDPKKLDQEAITETGRLTQNGLFERAALDYKDGTAPAEVVKVYEKIKPGIWAYNGLFRLTNAWRERSGGREVFKFRLELVCDAALAVPGVVAPDVENDRVIPTSVKLEVWRRDRGRCVKCGQNDNLHFDHVIPYSKGGSSKNPDNIQILCARHNIEKKDRIE